MIYYLNGPITILEPGLAVVECGGVGYGCRITAFTAAQLKLNQTARLYICNPSVRMPTTSMALPAGRSSGAMSF